MFLRFASRPLGGGAACGPASSAPLSSWWRLVRGGLLGTALSNYFLGYALEAGTDLRLSLTFWIVGVAVALLYAFGMGLNDLCDLEQDRTLHPTRPLPSGRISPRSAAFVLALFGVAALLLGVLAGPQPAFAVGHLCAWILAYNAGAKNHEFLGAISMGAVRASLVLLGSNVARASISDTLPVSPFATTSAWIAVGGYVALVTWLSMAEDDATTARSRTRHVALTTWVVTVACGIVVLQHSGLAGRPRIEIILAWLPVLTWTLFYTRRPLLDCPARTSQSTYRALLGLFLLDLAILVSYDLPSAALVPLALGAGHWLALLKRIPATIAKVRQ
ncbi:MAG: UbiA family prenyltransferase [Planctomycetota bacterium]